MSHFCLCLNTKVNNTIQKPTMMVALFLDVVWPSHPNIHETIFTNNCLAYFCSNPGWVQGDDDERDL